MRKMTYLLLGVVSLVAMLFAGVSSSNQVDQIFIELQGDYYSIPRDRLETGYPFWLEPLFRDGVDEVSVSVSIEEVAEYYNLQLQRNFGNRKIYINIHNHADPHPSRSVAERAWLGSPPYSGAAGVQETDFYYAIRHDESVNIWAVLSHRPNSYAAPPLSEFWIGICTSSSEIILSPATSCTTISDERSPAWYSFSLDGDLVPHIEYFREYFNEKISSWRVEHTMRPGRM
jgi:hypothetical protein